MARPLFDTAQNASTPPAGKNADLETRIEQLVALVNEHAPALDALEAGTTEAALAGANIANAVDGAVSPATLGGFVALDVPIAIPDHATQTLSYVTTRKIEIIGFDVLKDGANVAGTIQLTDGADVAITDAVAAATDKARTTAATIDPARRVLAAGATFKIIATRAGVKMTALVILRVLLRA